VTGRDHGDPIPRLADEAAPDVLAAALVRAREQATARLADLLTEAIVARALGSVRETSAEPRPAAPPTPPAPAIEPEVPGPGSTALYAYAVTRDDLGFPADGPGLTAGLPVSLVTDDGLGLLVSRVDPDELQVDPDDLSETGRLAVLARGHDTVVRAAVTAGPVLPLRFGTVVADEDGARRLLREHSAVARERLDRIGDAREWGVRLVRSLSEEQPVPAAAREGRTDVSGTEFLARRRQALQEREDAEQTARTAAQVLEEALAPHVTEALRRGGAPGSSLLLDVAYLVPPATEAAFLAETERLGGELRPRGLALEVTGPWPPYSFAALTAGGPDGA
jgi:Gas vesicle synthesis protein GvpL/GvpF